MVITSNHLTDIWSGQSLDDVLIRLDAEIEENNLFIDGNLEDTLLKEAKELFDNNPEELTATIVNELLDYGRITESEHAEWFEEYLP